VLCANYGSGTLAVIPSGPDGKLGDPTSFIQHIGKGPDPRQEAAHAHMIVSSPDNRYFYACDLGTDEVYIYSIDTTKGTLSETARPYHTLPGSGPRHLEFHPSLPVAYVVNELSGTVEVMSVDAANGGLTRLQTVSTIEGIEAAAGCADIHLTPSGRFLYVSNRSTVNNLAIFSTDPATGMITPAGHQALSGKTPRSFVIDPTGTFLLVAFQDTDNVSVFSIEHNTGNLTLVSETRIPTPVCLKIAGEGVN
jgi:6-phosphogluconolactonase